MPPRGRFPAPLRLVCATCNHCQHYLPYSVSKLAPPRSLAGVPSPYSGGRIPKFRCFRGVHPGSFGVQGFACPGVFLTRPPWTSHHDSPCARPFRSLVVSLQWCTMITHAWFEHTAQDFQPFNWGHSTLHSLLQGVGRLSTFLCCFLLGGTPVIYMRQQPLAAPSARVCPFTTARTSPTFRNRLFLRCCWFRLPVPCWGGNRATRMCPQRLKHA